MIEIIPTKFVISPPFGNWIDLPGCTSILGSFTWQARPGLVGQVLRTLRPIKGGWINRIGLRNCGIRTLKFRYDCIYSLVGLNTDDWQNMFIFCPEGLRIEVNLGCPNVHTYGIPLYLLAAYCRKFRVIAKLSPTVTMETIGLYVAAGVTHFHLCNTLPSPRGGISGRPLQPLVLDLITAVAAKYPSVTILAGGGIYQPSDCQRYEQAGAKHFSLSTIWFTPWRVPAVLAER